MRGLFKLALGAMIRATLRRSIEDLCEMFLKALRVGVRAQANVFIERFPGMAVSVAFWGDCVVCRARFFSVVVFSYDLLVQPSLFRSTGGPRLAGIVSAWHGLCRSRGLQERPA